jgi:hypothetical protein
MKNFTLILALVFFTATGFSQACPNILPSSGFTASGNNITLTVNYTANGQKHIQYSIKCSGSVIRTGCISVKGDGSDTLQFSCSGAYSVTLTPGTGTCDHGTTCGDVVIISSPVVEAGPLPVVMGNLGIQRKSEKVLISWQTFHEIELSGFEIQRAYDNSSYQTIGKVSAHVNSNSVLSYSFEDNSNTAKGVSFYRIKMIDKDGGFSYSPIKSIKGLEGKSDFIVFPNPSNGSAKITITDLNEPTVVEVVDNSGRLVKTVTLTNSNFVQINDLHKGGYFIKITRKESGATSAKKLSVIN